MLTVFLNHLDPMDAAEELGALAIGKVQVGLSRTLPSAGDPDRSGRGRLLCASLSA